MPNAADVSSPEAAASLHVNFDSFAVSNAGFAWSVFPVHFPFLLISGKALAGAVVKAASVSAVQAARIATKTVRGMTVSPLTVVG